MKMLSGGEQTHLLGDARDSVRLTLSHVSQSHVNAPHSCQPVSNFGVDLPLVSH